MTAIELTHKWAKKNGIASETMGRVGLSDRLIRSRTHRTVEALRKLGLTNSQEYKAMAEIEP